MFLVNLQADILYKNTHAEQILAQRAIAQCLHGKLVIDAPQARRLDRVLASVSREIGDGPAAGCLALTAPDGSVWILQIRTRPFAGMGDAATVVIVLREVLLDLDAAAALVSNLFALTRAERRVLPAVVRLGTLGEIAASLGLSETTIRTHLGNIFAKTGTKSRKDLVRLVGGFATACGL
jgi:DNA-binding CsgD family transcriptional regulator